MEISVVIPVYNTRPYLRECIESVIASECFPLCEILMVNDGSTDGSEAILREYAKKYDRIRCLDYGCPPWNRGLSAARNFGSEQANGKYLFFLDSDDALLPGYLSALYRAAEERNCDIVYAGISRWNEEIRPIPRPALAFTDVISGRDFIKRRMDMRDEQNYIVNALYLTSLFREKGLCCDGTVHLYEDVLFSWQAAALAERVTAVNEFGYLYRVRSGSLVQSGVHLRDLKNIAVILTRLSEEPEEDALNRFCFMVISMYLYYLGMLSENGTLTRKQQDEYFRRLSALKLLPRLRRSAATRREKMKWLIWRINWRLFYPLVKK